MTKKRPRRSHSEERWATMPEHIVRCVGTHPSGAQCRRVANDGTNVCDVHGGAAPQVRKRAAERISLTADRAVEVILEMLNDTTLAAPVRLKAAQDILDRQGLVAAKVVQILPGDEDPLQSLFSTLLDNPNALEDDQPLALAPPVMSGPVVFDDGSITGPVLDHNPWEDADDDHTAVVAEVLEPEYTPQRIKDAIREGRYVP